MLAGSEKRAGPSFMLRGLPPPVPWSAALDIAAARNHHAPPRCPTRLRRTRAVVSTIYRTSPADPPFDSLLFSNACLTLAAIRFISRLKAPIGLPRSFSEANSHFVAFALDACFRPGPRGSRLARTCWYLQPLATRVERRGLGSFRHILAR
ncbi:hypothetical protein N658DRAFT_302456 [Parathielavia hyrcaniae]|uniref:Uncharacterized protein n=1 Tax=Parathielavia hyrcaniae TaxID=113614 RepID=A0AAN6Q6J2_9PEZI|nr:hypothetical protein N658DRAFT_302456 [Parathielavia hyrcaniae]